MRFSSIRAAIGFAPVTKTGLPRNFFSSLLIDRLADARDHARPAARYVSRLSLDGFATDAITRDAVCFALMVVGEGCVEATKEMTDPPLDIPWAAIKGMRNLLIHEYWQIDDTIVYNTARNDAEPLADQLEKLIKDRA